MENSEEVGLDKTLSLDHFLTAKQDTNLPPAVNFVNCFSHHSSIQLGKGQTREVCDSPCEVESQAFRDFGVPECDDVSTFESVANL